MTTSKEHQVKLSDQVYRFAQNGQEINAFSVYDFKLSVKSKYVFLDTLWKLHVNLAHRMCVPSVFPLRVFSWGQFYQILWNWRGSCAKIINLGWKLAKWSRKSIFFTHSHNICWVNFSKCWANFATYGLRGNTVYNHGNLFSLFQSGRPKRSLGILARKQQNILRKGDSILFYFFFNLGIFSLKKRSKWIKI